MVARVPLDPADPEPPPGRCAALPGGWSLTSADERFGGLSGLHVEAGAVTAVSDVGVVMRFPLPGARDRLPVRFDPLVEGPGPAPASPTATARR